MTWQIAIALFVTMVVFFGFVRERWPPEIVAFAGVSLLLAAGVLPLADLLAVFSNAAPLTIGAMFVVSAGLERTGVISALGRTASRWARDSWLRAMLLMLLPVMVLSAFVNNTPVVVILTPVLLTLARRSGIPATKLLIPLSFISIFGGTCTLLGTSTNLLVDGLAQERGLEPFGIFEISGVGLVMAAAGALYLLLFGWWLLPSRNPAIDPEELMRRRRFLCEFVVPPGSPLENRRFAETSIARMAEVRVVDVIRAPYSMKRAIDELTLRVGDRLVIDCPAESVATLRDTAHFTLRDQPGALASVESTETQIIEAIVGPETRIAGLPIAELDLPHRFGVYCIAVHRNKRRLKRDFEKLQLKVGDILLLEGSSTALERLAASPQFINVSTPKLRPVRSARAPIAVAILAVVVLAAAILDLPIAALAVMGATTVVLTRCIEPDDAYEAIQWPILLLIYGMLAIGRALEATGAMDYLVEKLTGLVTGLGPVAVLAVLYLLTSVLTEIMSNNAAAILLTPIAIGLAEAMGVDPRPLVVAVMLAGSASFATPIGYQTNTFVYRAGNYRFVDFVRVGLPLNLLLWAVAVWLVPMVWPF